MTSGNQDEARVVVGVDGTRTALDAVRWAATEARLRGVPLQIVHAAPYAAGGGLQRRVRGILGAAFTVARRAAPGVAVTTRPTTDEPARALVAAGESMQLLVVGIPEQTVSELLLPSVALDVATHAPCPVAVVRGRRRTGDEPVLVGIDDPQVDAAALAAAFAEADLHASPLVVLHAHGGLRNHVTGDAGDATARLAEAINDMAGRYPRVPARIRSVADTPTNALLAAAGSARMVVVGSHGRGPAARALVGSHSRDLLRHSPVTVLLVAPDARRTEPIRPVGAAGDRA